MSSTEYGVHGCESAGTCRIPVEVSEPSDGALLEAVAQADVQSFERLYARFERRMYHYALNFVRDPSSAEEIVLDSMLAVWNGATGYHRSSQASTWLLGIVRHKALDAVRRQQRHQSQVPLDLAAEIADTSRQPDDSANDVAVADFMQKAMRLLSQEHREILFLTFHEDLSYYEVSRLLSIPENTAKTRAYHAKLNLRKHLTQLDAVGAVR